MTDTPPVAPVVAPAKEPSPWWMPDTRGVLAFLSTLLFAVALLAPLLGKGFVVDADLKGAIIIQWGAVMGWFFGASKGSAQKDDTNAAMAAKQ